MRRHKFFVILSIFIGIGCGGWYMAHTPRQYDSVASLRVQSPPTDQQGLTLNGVDSAARTDLVNDIAVFAMAVNSPTIRDLPLVRSQKSPIEYVKSHVRISSAAGSEEVRLVLASSSPDDARAVLDSILSACVRVAETRNRAHARPAAALSADKQPAEAANPSDQQSRPGGTQTSTLDDRRSLLEERARTGDSLAKAGEDSAHATALYQEAVEFFGSEAALQSAAILPSATLLSDVELKGIHERLMQLRRLIGAASPDESNRGDVPEFRNLSEAYATAVCARAQRARDALQQLQARFDRLVEQSRNVDRANDRPIRTDDNSDRPVTHVEAVGDNAPLGSPAQDARVGVSIAKPAQTLWNTAWPQPLPVYATFAILFLILGSLGAWISDSLSTRLRDPIDASMTARAPLLGRIPTLSRDLSSPALRGQSVLVKAESAPAWRQIVKALDSVFVARFDKTVLFTAPGESRGKSLLASNLAIAMAQAGHRVVLVDGHPGRSAVGEIYGAGESVGLGDAIQGRVPLISALRATGLPKLEVLPLGRATTAWRQILNSQSFVDLLNELSERFDRVLIDGGPAASDECRILGAYCDIAVLLSDARCGNRKELRQAAEAVRTLGARVGGLVWNRSPRPTPISVQVFPRRSETFPRPDLHARSHQGAAHTNMKTTAAKPDGAAASALPPHFL